MTTISQLALPNRRAPARSDSLLGALFKQVVKPSNIMRFSKSNSPSALSIALVGLCLALEGCTAGKATLSVTQSLSATTPTPFSVSPTKPAITPKPIPTATATLTPPPSTPSPSTNPQVIFGPAIEYGPVSFTYQTALYGESALQGTGRIVTDREYFDLTLPDYIEITLAGFPASDLKPQIAIYVISDLERLTSNQSDDRNSKVKFDALRTLLNGKPLSPGWTPISFFVMGYRTLAQIEYLDFQSGAGIRAVHDLCCRAVTPINNKQLFYTFQGFTQDGMFFVSATFPVSAPFLLSDPYQPNNANPNAIPFPSYTDDLASFENAQRVYDKEAMQQLRALSPDGYTPNLKLLDALISTLVVK